MSVTGVTRRVAELSSAARCAEDAEASGVHAEELVADLSRAVGLLGAPDVPLAAPPRWSSDSGAWEPCS